MLQYNIVCHCWFLVEVLLSILVGMKNFLRAVAWSHSCFCLSSVFPEVQVDSKLLSGFPWPIIFKPEK
jgi:hypothetical protein